MSTTVELSEARRNDPVTTHLAVHRGARDPQGLCRALDIRVAVYQPTHDGVAFQRFDRGQDVVRGHPALRREILHAYGPAGLSSYQATDDRLDLPDVLRPGALLKQRKSRRGVGVLAVRSVPPQEEPDQLFDVVMAMTDRGHLYPGIEQLVEVVVGTDHRRSSRHDQLPGGGSIELLQEVRQLLAEAMAQQ